MCVVVDFGSSIRSRILRLRRNRCVNWNMRNRANKDGYFASPSWDEGMMVMMFMMLGIQRGLVMMMLPELFFGGVQVSASAWLHNLLPRHFLQ